MKKDHRARMTLVCADCGRRGQFIADDIESLPGLIDYVGWHEYPGDMEVKARCPECEKIYTEG